jgi:hypothetical protein
MSKIKGYEIGGKPFFQCPLTGDQLAELEKILSESSSLIAYSQDPMQFLKSFFRMIRSFLSIVLIPKSNDTEDLKQLSEVKFSTAIVVLMDCWELNTGKFSSVVQVNKDLH